MKSSFRLLFITLVSVIFLGCGSKSDQKVYQDLAVQEKEYVSTGGIVKGKILCPQEVNDVIVNLESLNPMTKVGEPEMSIDGVMKFIQENEISLMTDLLNHLPSHFKNNFSLVEHTKGEGQSNLRFPRIVLFGSDGTFLMNISTKPDDPKYDLLDCAELNEDSGFWEFSQFDFTAEKPQLHRNPSSCIRCHGDNPRPVWGSNMDWPGVFGDNEAAGPNGEALSYRHVVRMKEIIEGNTYSDRFDFLKWSDQPLTSGGIRRIADHAFGAELLVSNMAMGTATARGVYTRIKKKTPSLYKEMREVLLLLGYEHMVPNILSDIEKQEINKIIKSFGGQKGNLDEAFRILGVDPKEAFSLGTLAKEEEPKTDWSLGAGDLYEQVFLQVLYDLIIEDEKAYQILVAVPNSPGVFGCEGLGNNIKEVVDFKMLHMHQLLGSARYEVNKVYYSQDAENIKEKVFIPLYDKLVPYLKEKAFNKSLASL
ncbi:hypothetical protein [Aquimarina litoralis]|uniref:hypothetical protein n=1 Tax=Aquimarina litoralis TaxID=584605 RepID=UPI001C55BE8C|nr:hypothetical protein [Aquimarina litoralis]MBW1294437.1 hypothetical protein [Aquimarina litoralis]